MTYCWVIVDPPWATPPTSRLVRAARAMPSKSTPSWVQKPLILDGDDRVLQDLRDLRRFDLYRAVEPSEHGDTSTGGVVDDGGLGHDLRLALRQLTHGQRCRDQGADGHRTSHGRNDHRGDDERGQQPQTAGQPPLDAFLGVDRSLECRVG